MKIADIFTRDSVIKSLDAATKQDALREISKAVSRLAPSLNEDTLFKMLVQREEVCSTALDHGVAVPHLRMHGLAEPVAVFARSERGIDFGSLDGKPTTLFVAIISSDSRADQYISLLADVTSALKKSDTRKRLAEAESEKDILEILTRQDPEK